jgi:alpha-tubulin suppressor-like RCC1 family protein
VTATGLSGAIGVTSGFTHACAWFTNGTGSCWGENQFGQLGNPVSNPVDNGSTVVTVGSKVPVAIHNPSGISFSSLSAGIWFTCGVATNGTAWCWGIEGPVLGNPSASTNTPVQVIGW